MSDTTTTNYGFIKPEISASNSTWGNKLNSDMDAIDTAIKNAFDLGNAALPKAGGTMAGTLVLAADPANPLEAATKQYVDNVAAGLDIKQSVRAATTAALASNTFSAGVITSTTNNAFPAVDGVTLNLNDRIIVKNQASTLQHGIYYLSQQGTGSVPWKLTRAVDMDAWTEVPGASAWVEEGTANADTAWVCTSNTGGTINSTAITWAQFGGTGAFQAANARLTNIAALSVVNAGSLLTVSSSNVVGQLYHDGVNSATYALLGYSASGSPTWLDKDIGFVNLGNISTASGSSVDFNLASAISAITGNARPFKEFLLVLNGCSMTTSVAFTLAISTDNGASFSTSVAITNTGAAAGIIEGTVKLHNVGVINGSLIAATFVEPRCTSTSGTAYNTNAIITNKLGVLTNLRIAGGTMDAGSIDVYGIR